VALVFVISTYWAVPAVKKYLHHTTHQKKFSDGLCGVSLKLVVGKFPRTDVSSTKEFSESTFWLMILLTSGKDFLLWLKLW
jgi:hypothetical protein